MVFFTVQKLVSLLRFVCLFFFLFLLPWGTKKLVWFISENVLLCSPIGFLWCCVLYFKSLNHFEFILHMMWGSVLISLIYMRLPSFPNTTCWRDCFLSIVYSCLLCCRLIDCSVYFWALYFVPLIHLVFFFVLIPFCLMTVAHCSIVWSLGWLCLLLCSFSSRLICQFWVLYGSIYKLEDYLF